MRGETTPVSRAGRIVFDLSELHDAATLMLICRGCGTIFQSDFEEDFCACCVERRELLNLPKPR